MLYQLNHCLSSFQMLLLKRLMVCQSALGKVGQERLSFPSSWFWSGCSWSNVSSFGSFDMTKTWIYWKESNRGPPKWSRKWRRSSETWHCSSEMSPGGNLPICINTHRESKKSQALSMVPSPRTRHSGHKQEPRWFNLNIRKHFCTVQMKEHWNRLVVQSGSGVSFLGYLWKLPGYAPGQSALVSHT